MAVESFTSMTVSDVTPRRTSKRSHALFEALEKEIVLGTLKPEQALTEMDLAQRFECSQGTVREALMRLNEEGLVNRLPNRGTTVAPCHADDARAVACAPRGRMLLSRPRGGPRRRDARA